MLDPSAQEATRRRFEWRNVRLLATGFSAGLALWTGIPAAPAQAEVPASEFKFDYADALAKSFLFYEAQRSGAASPRVEWRKPAALKDGSEVQVDLSGGWFDAGDHVKFGLPMAYSATMLGWSLHESKAAYTAVGQHAIAKDNLRFALDYFLAAYREGDTSTVADDVFYYQVGDGNLDHAFWGPPEKMTMARPAFACTRAAPCSEVLAGTAAALAVGSLVFGDDDPAYATLLRNKARRLYRFADLRSNVGYRAANGFYSSFSGFWDELAWGATWLHLATAEGQYLTAAIDAIARANDGVYFAHTWDNVSNGTHLLLARITQQERYRDRIEAHLEHWLKRLPMTSGGLVFLDTYGSLRYASTTAFLALAYANDVDSVAEADLYQRFALSQINYILGENPRNSSYVCGFGNNPPKNPHHRAGHDSATFSIDSPVTNRHVLTGALVGGPKSKNDFDWADDRRDFIANEVATDYNAGYTGALAAILALDRRIGAPVPVPIPVPGPVPVPVPAPVPVPVPVPSPGGANAQVVITSDWGAGYCAEVRVTTSSADPVDWSVRFAYAGNLTQLWNASYTTSGGHVTAEGLSWNNTVRAGQLVSFGFCANR